MASRAVEFPARAVDIDALPRASLTAEQRTGGEEINSVFNSSIAQATALP
jgi:hypothetical protein